MRYFFESKDNIEINERHNLDFPSHLHDFFEIGYLEKGTVTLTVEEKNYYLNSGNFFVIFPNQIHSYGNSENLLVKMLIFHPIFLAEYNNIFNSKIPECAMLENDDDATKILRLIFELKIDKNDSNILKGLLLSLFGLLLKEMTFKNVEKYNISTIKSILLFCNEHFTEPIKVSDVADNLHISRYYIAHIFRERLNTTFSEHITNKRLNYAATLLTSQNLSVLDVAYRSGFDSIRTFNRNFLKLYNVTPREYKKTKGGKEIS